MSVVDRCSRNPLRGYGGVESASLLCDSKKPFVAILCAGMGVLKDSKPGFHRIECLVAILCAGMGVLKEISCQQILEIINVAILCAGMGVFEGSYRNIDENTPQYDNENG